MRRRRMLAEPRPEAVTSASPHVKYVGVHAKYVGAARDVATTYRRTGTVQAGVAKLPAGRRGRLARRAVT